MTSAADVTFDWQGTAKQLVSDTPAWALAAIGGVVTVVALIVGYLAWTRASKRRAEREQYHRDILALAREEGQPLPPEPLHMDAKPLLGGIAVSLYGLWGFATETVGLPFFFAIGFVSMFDILELRLFAQMYKMADPQKGWTRELRTMRATAWGFVTASAAANVAHAPSLWAAPFLAAMPIGAAWVIEVPLRNALAAAEPEEEKRPEGTKPGPLRLITLLWRRVWAWCFRKAGMDVSDRADEMIRRARARDAADASYDLRLALKEKEKLEKIVGQNTSPRGRGKGKVSADQKRLDTLNRDLAKKIRPKAQTALELADTQDPEQGLQLMQRMAWLTRADDVALLDYGPESPAMEVLEQLNIAANAEFIKSAKRARDAEALAAKAEQDRADAEAEVKEAKAALADLSKRTEDAQKTVEEAAADVEAEQQKLEALRDERERLESSGTSADQLYQRAADELKQVREELASAVEDAHAAGERILRMEGEQRNLEERLQLLTEERDKLVVTARNERDRAVSLQAQLAQIKSLQPAAVSAKTPKQPGQVDARIGSGTRSTAAGETRQRIRELLKGMTPEQIEQAKGPRNSIRELARHLIAAHDLDLGPDAVRGHISEIEKETEEAQARGEVPAPRGEDDHAGAEHEQATS